VATHHKTGTVWMDGVFKAIARDVGVEYVDFRSQYARLADALSKPFILLNHDSNFREYAHILDRHDVRILHVVRDPRDVLISAMLGFDESEQQVSSRCFWQNSLFAGLSRLGNKHVRSGDVAQWKREFTRDLGCAFLARFPDVLQSLGYEIDNSWIARLQESSV